MALPTKFFKALAAMGIALLCMSANAGIYQFQFSANPDALEVAPDASLDVLHTVTIDTSKISAFNIGMLQATSSWLNGGIQMTMSHQGKTVLLNDGIDPMSPTVSVPGTFSSEGFLSLWPGDTGFFALEFAPGNPFIDANALPYDPFVYGFLFVYQQQAAYKDFSALWSGNTSVLPAYLVSTVPEPGVTGLMAIALIGCAYVSKRTRKRF